MSDNNQKTIQALSDRVDQQDREIQDLKDEIASLKEVVTPLTSRFPTLQAPPTGNRGTRRGGQTAPRPALTPATFAPPQPTTPGPGSYFGTNLPVPGGTRRGLPIADSVSYRQPVRSNKSMLPFTVEDIAAKNKRVHRPNMQLPTCRACNASGILVSCFRDNHWNWCTHHKRMAHTGDVDCGYGHDCYINYWESVTVEEWEEMVRFSFATKDGLGRRGLTEEELRNALFSDSEQ